MTDRDDRRVAKALQGAGFPADRASLVSYAETRGANSKTLQALHTIPDATYHNAQAVIDAVPQEPEGDQPGGTARADARQSPTHEP
ncbi:MAG: DUF2795 domain-containing protein [Streptosporangiales bacterium]